MASEWDPLYPPGSVAGGEAPWKSPGYFDSAKNKLKAAAGFRTNAPLKFYSSRKAYQETKRLAASPRAKMPQWWYQVHREMVALLTQQFHLPVIPDDRARGLYEIPGGSRIAIMSYPSERDVYRVSKGLLAEVYFFVYPGELMKKNPDISRLIHVPGALSGKKMRSRYKERKDGAYYVTANGMSSAMDIGAFLRSREAQAQAANG